MNKENYSLKHDLPVELAEALRADAARRAERPMDFWNQQQARISARMTDRHPAQRSPLRFALVAAALLFCAVLLLDTPSGRTTLPVGKAQVESDVDNDLLLAIERSLAAGTPRALEPATPVLESRSNSNDVPNSTKEQHHEN